MYTTTLTTALIALLLAILTSAAPAQIESRQLPGPGLKNIGPAVAKAAPPAAPAAACNMNKAVLPQAPIALPAVSSGLVLAHVAVGRGTQNYTCPPGGSAADVPSANGAFATLFNVSCLVGSMPQLVAAMPGISMRLPVPASPDALAAANTYLSGHHYFADATTPFFNLDTPDGNLGMVAAAKLNATAAPDAARNVPWLKLKAKPGDWQFAEVYRVNTAGGQPPATCKGQPENVLVDYSAEYWLYAQGTTS